MSHDLTATTTVPATRTYPHPVAVLELLKPITWFAPMWAFGCGVASAAQVAGDRWYVLAIGAILAGPMVCGCSQAVNDWFDRHVDAINEPHRPIPSGRVPDRWGIRIAIVWTFASLGVATLLGVWGFAAAAVALALAWAYSAPPFRLKSNGWWGNAAVGLCYEGLPWFTAAAILTGGLPDARILALALLYSIGAHGIMTLNDFKSVDGDRTMGVRTLPVQLGPDRACRLACLVMTLPQCVVVGLLIDWGRPFYASAVATLIVVQILLMARLLKAPCQRAPWYNATGTTLYVIGMLVSAFAVAPLVSVAA